MPKRTHQPKVRRRNKKHGFLKRMKSKGGKKTIKNRRQKGRKKLSGWTYPKLGLFLGSALRFYLSTLTAHHRELTTRWAVLYTGAMLAKQYRFSGLGSVRPALRHGKTARGPGFRVKYLYNQRREHPRVAVMISKKVSKKAVTRNRIRRRFMESIREFIDQVTGPYDIVITVYDEGYATSDWDKLTTDIKRAFTSAGMLEGRSSEQWTGSKEQGTAKRSRETERESWITNRESWIKTSVERLGYEDHSPT